MKCIGFDEIGSARLMIDCIGLHWFGVYIYTTIGVGGDEYMQKSLLTFGLMFVKNEARDSRSRRL